ncbi:FkbM family methyltransferase [Microcoleus sp. CZ3-B2]
MSDVTIQVDEFDGQFVLGPQSHLLHRLLAEGEYERDLVKLFLKHLDPVRDVIDVGANVGFFTVLAARSLTSGRVLAAEPTRAAFARLSHNIDLNGVEDAVIMYNGLISDKDCTSTINVVAGREEYSSMGDVVHPAVIGEKTLTETIDAKKIDTLVETHNLTPGLIKVDVEGAEGLVFEGARETLKRHRPIVISEFSRPLLEANGSSPERLAKLFDECDYDVFDAHDQFARAGHLEFSDLLAVPR